MDAGQLGDGDVGGADRHRAARLAVLVRDHRRAAGLTQRRLAESAKVSLAAIRDLEQGRTRRPRAGSLARLTAALGLDAAEAGKMAALVHVGSRAAGSGEAGPGESGTASGLRLQILGPLVAWRDGARLALGGPRQQAVLGLLALAPGSLVHRSAIIDVLWPAGPPATAVSAVQSHISRLRGLLAGQRPMCDGDGPTDDKQSRRDGWPGNGSARMGKRRPPGDGGRLLVSAGACYCLRAGPGELDLLDFGQVADDARAARRPGDRGAGRPASRRGPCDPGAAAAAGVSHEEARAALDELTAAHLLTEHVPDRFTCHDLLRAHAAEQAETLISQTERRAALHRMLGRYLHSAHAADLRLYPARRRPTGNELPAAGTATEHFADDTQALAWFDAEHQVLLATVGLAAAEGFDACAWRLAWAMETFFFRRTHLHDWAATQRTALTASRRLGDRNGRPGPTVTSATTSGPPRATAAPWTCSPSSGTALNGPRPSATPATPTTRQETRRPPGTPGRKPSPS